MKNFILPIALLGLFSCGNNSEHQHDHKHSHASSDESAAKVQDYKTHDPVCGMEREAGWEHFSVYNNDTVMFCAEYCKKGFDLNSDKYTSIQ